VYYLMGCNFWQNHGVLPWFWQKLPFGALTELWCYRNLSKFTVNPNRHTYNIANFKKNQQGGKFHFSALSSFSCSPALDVALFINSSQALFLSYVGLAFSKYMQTVRGLGFKIKKDSILLAFSHAQNYFGFGEWQLAKIDRLW